MKKKPRYRRGQPLTPPEQQVCKLLCHGKTNAQIARMMKRSVKTIETWRRGVHIKTGQKSLVKLVLWAYGIKDGCCPACGAFLFWKLR